MEHLDFIGLITIAFLGSIGHCSGMCGGFVIAYTSAKVDEKWKKAYQALAHFLYNFGRVISYTFLGIIFGFIGSVISVSMAVKGWLFLFVGLIMILMGFSLMGKLKFLNYIESSIAEKEFFKKWFKYLLTSNSLISFLFLGILNGLIPCGFVYFFLAGATATASPFEGGLVMAIFGLSTIPVLFTLGFVFSFLKSGKLRKVMMNLSAILVIAFGIFTMFKASMLIQGKMPMKKMDNTKLEKVFN